MEEEVGPRGRKILRLSDDCTQYLVQWFPAKQPHYSTKYYSICQLDRAVAAYKSTNTGKELNVAHHSKETIYRFFGLCDWLIQTYDFRKCLFDDNPDEGALRDKRHEHFFYRIHVTFQESWMQQLAKLHDPAKQGAHFNLSLEYIIEYHDWEPDIKQELQNLKDEMNVLYLLIRDARNKLLSHNDYKTMHGPDKYLGEFEEGEDIKYFSSLKEFCEKVSQDVCDEPFLYDDMVQNDVDVFMSQFIGGKAGE